MLELLLVAFIIIQAFLHSIERRDMLNRLMSKDLTDYKQGGVPPKHIPSAHNRVLNKWRNKAGDD
jgi:hypothetical protein